jgi:uncharacterized protein YggU (UPF0235/DUF167 family)
MTALMVKVSPRAGRDAIDGWVRDNAGRLVLQVRVAAQPVDGEANEAVEALLAKALRRPKSAVTVASGQSARLKRLELDGVTVADLTAAFGLPRAR